MKHDALPAVYLCDGGLHVNVVVLFRSISGDVCNVVMLLFRFFERRANINPAVYPKLR